MKEVNNKIGELNKSETPKLSLLYSNKTSISFSEIYEFKIKTQLFFFNSFKLYLFSIIEIY